MGEQAGLSEREYRSSPWPPFIALGFVLSELGVLFGGALIPVAVGGVVLLEASVVGILRESGYADTLWTPTLAVGVLFTAAGGVLFYWGMQIRSVAVASAGTVAVLAATGFWLAENDHV